MSSRKRLGLFALTPLILVSCGKDSTTGPAPSDQPVVYLASLSGVWNGLMHIVRTGNCTLGGADSTAVPVIFLVNVESDGTVTAFTETYEPISGLDHEWSGSIGSDLSVDLTDEFQADCDGSLQSDTAPYSGKITVLGDEGYRLVASSEENWCPAFGCTFRVRYDLTMFRD